MTVTDYNRSIDVGAMPDRIRRLPISDKGYPVPWFVTWFKDGKPCEDGEGIPDFRVVNPRKMSEAMNQHKCWICSAPMGAFKCFVIGPMCSITKTISEPPSHRECSIFAAKSCPFLANPRMTRNEKGMLDEDGKLRPGLNEPGGIGLLRNPGVACVWITKSYRPFRPHRGQPSVLFELGAPVEVMWFAEGRRATRTEVMASINSGYPALFKMAQQEGADAVDELEMQRAKAMALVPEL